MTFGLGVALAERGLVPLPLVRRAIRALCAERLDLAMASGRADAFLANLRRAPIASVPDLANAQHYEVPSAFFELVLGRHRKYSCAWWPEGVKDLDAAEHAMLALSCDRAGLANGQDILELGCGWGSLSLFMAGRFPAARILAVSNSVSQREFLEPRRPANLEVRTADMNTFEPGRQFDRIVSIEMFEHMRDWPTLLERLSGWLKPGGQAFVHVFCHARVPYAFEPEGDRDWMARHFFSGGIMPSWDLLPRLAPRDLPVIERWWIDGTHYQRTAAAWRRNLETRRDAVLRVFQSHYGLAAAELWYHRWRLFFLACEELFGFAGGREWGVGHYRLVHGAASVQDERP